MKLTRAVSYAVGISLQIDDARQAGPVTAATIARHCKFPPRFLYRVLRRMVDAGLLVGTSGPSGGYCLARPLTAITLLDVVAAVESRPEASVLEPVRSKHRLPIAKINQLCELSAEYFTRELARVTLAQLRGGKPASRPRGKNASVNSAGTHSAVRNAAGGAKSSAARRLRANRGGKSGA